MKARTASLALLPLLLLLLAPEISAVPSDFSCATVTEIPQAECEALVALYNSTDGANWTDNSGWLVTDWPCSWHGVSCSLGHVHRLTLNQNQLSGNIPPELGNLSTLETLTLYVNQLSGSIPPELGNLANLQHLYLWVNQLNGSIPPELGNLASLRYLYLYNNQLSGSIPPELGNLANLQHLDLSSNQLSGNIPPELGNLSTLETLILYENQLSGSIPPELGSLSTLETLTLYENQLSGSIPPELGNLASLTFLVLSHNQLSGNIPPELGNLAILERLDLYENQLSGSIPPELGNLANLRLLHLGRNQLSGNIPPELGNLATLEALYLPEDQLSGSIPPELGNLAYLQLLHLGGNQLDGSIPPELGNLVNLYNLYLHTNQLSGELPQSLINLTRLVEFWFHETDLCEPAEADFQAWLAGISSLISTGVICGSGPAFAVGQGDGFFTPEAGERAIPGPVYPRGQGQPAFSAQIGAPGEANLVTVEILGPSGQSIQAVSLLRSSEITWLGRWDWSSPLWSVVPDQVPAGEYTARFTANIDGAVVAIEDLPFYVIFDPLEVTAPGRFAFNETGVWFGSSSRRGFPFGPLFGLDRALVYSLHPDDQRVFSLAIDAIAGKTSQYDAAQTLLSLENALFDYDLGWHGNDVIHLLEEETAAQCADDANMLIALFRSVGIPSHPVTVDAALEHGDATWTFDTWIEARLDGPSGEQWYALHPHEGTGLGPVPRDEAGQWGVATKSTNDLVIMAKENWEPLQVADSERDLEFGYNQCDEPHESFEYQASWIDHLCIEYWNTGHWTCPRALQKGAESTPEIGISLDSEIYSVGATVLATVTISNPAEIPISSMAVVSIAVDSPVSMLYPDEVLEVFTEPVLVEPTSTQVVTYSYTLPQQLWSGDHYYVDAVYSGTRAVATYVISPRFGSEVALPDNAQVAEEFACALTVTNPLGRAIENVTVTLQIPVEMSSEDPLVQHCPAIDAGATLTATWALVGLSQSEVSQLILTVETADAGNHSTWRGIVIRPNRIFLPLLLRSY